MSTICKKYSYKLIFKQAKSENLRSPLKEKKKVEDQKKPVHKRISH